MSDSKVFQGEVELRRELKLLALAHIFHHEYRLKELVQLLNPSQLDLEVLRLAVEHLDWCPVVSPSLLREVSCSLPVVDLDFELYLSLCYPSQRPFLLGL